MASRPRLLFVANNVAFFVSHRLPIACEAQRRGYEVSLVTGLAGSPVMEEPAVQSLAEAGIRHFRLRFTSSGMNPLRDAWEIARMYRLMRRLRPDVVHAVSPKGILYGGVVARLARSPAVVLAISGMGYSFTGRTPTLRRSVAALVYRVLLGFALKHKNRRLVVQNRDDAETLKRMFGAADADLVLIAGSGVDLAQFSDASPEAKSHMVLLPARLLKDKGVVEFLTAAAQLKPLNADWRFIVAGASDYKNPSALSDAELQCWRAGSGAELVGYQSNMVPWYLDASIVCLPSYREGMPKALLEAAAAGCAVVTTDVPGCRDAIIPGRTGDLVPVEDAEALTRSLQALINDRSRRIQYAAAGKALAAQRFGIEQVVDQTLCIYRRLLETANGSANTAARAH